MRSLIVYDAECPYCTGTAKIASLSRQFEAAPFRSDEAQRVLNQAFAEPGFTLFLFRADRVYWGDEAAREISEMLRFPQVLVSFFQKSYPKLVKLFSFLSGRDEGFRSPEHGECEKCSTAEHMGGEKELDEDTVRALAEVLSKI